MIIKNEYMLPFSYPLVSSYFHHGHLNGILGSSSNNTLPWILSNYINLSIPKIFNNYTLDFYLTHQNVWKIWDDCPWIYQQQIGRKTINNNWISIIDFLIDSINNGYYICGFLNQYYIPSSHHFKIKHRKHPTLIFGYNNKTKQFNIADNLKAGKYTITTLGYEELELAYKTVEHVYNFNQYESFRLISYKEGNFIFDTEKIKEEIKRYLFPKEVIHTYIDSNKYVIGVDVYDYMRKYIEVLSHPRIRKDIRPFHVLKEHKKLMLMRVDFLIKSQVIGDSDRIRLAFSNIYRESEILLNLVLKYFVSKNELLLKNATNVINNMKELEVPALNKLICDLTNSREEIQTICLRQNNNLLEIGDKIEINFNISSPGVYEVIASVYTGQDCGIFSISCDSGFFINNEFFNLYDLYKKNGSKEKVRVATIQFDLLGNKKIKIELVGKNKDAVKSKIHIESISTKKLSHNESK